LVRGKSREDVARNIYVGGGGEKHVVEERENGELLILLGRPGTLDLFKEERKRTEERRGDWQAEGLLFVPNKETTSDRKKNRKDAIYRHNDKAEGNIAE